MKNTKVTKDYLINFLIEIYKARYYHKDFQELYALKLKTLCNFLDIKDCIIFDYTDKKFIIKRNNKNFISTDIMNEKEFLSIDRAEEIIVYNINRLFELITQERTIRSRGQLCSNDDIELVYDLLNAYRDDFAINSMNDAIINIYKENIKKSLTMLFEPYYYIDELNCWEINKVMDSETEEIMNKSLDEYDYV